MSNLIIGVVLLVITLALYIWVLPTEGQSTWVTKKWGMTTLLPLAIACLGIAGLSLIAKGLVS